MKKTKKKDRKRENKAAYTVTLTKANVIRAEKRGSDLSELLEWLPIEMAKKAFHEKSKKLTFLKFSDGIVTRRFYRNAPPADRDIICVQFVYEEAIGGGGLVGPRGFIYTRADRPTPVLQALIRKDLSKIYLKRIHYKAE
jgi:hypothetical protein